MSRDKEIEFFKDLLTVIHQLADKIDSQQEKIRKIETLVNTLIEGKKKQ